MSLVDALGELGARARRRRWRGSAGDRRPPARRRARARSPSRENARLIASTARRRSPISAMPCSASCASHVASDVTRPAPRRGSGRCSALRCASACAYARRVGDPRRPQRGDELVEMGPAQRRRALDQLEPVGQEHADKRTLGDVEQPLDGGAVDPHPLRLAGLEPDRQLVRPVVGLAASTDDARRCRRRTGPPRARSPSGTSGPYSRSRAPRAGSSCRRRSGPRRPSARRRAPPRRPRSSGSPRTLRPHATPHRACGPTRSA